MKLANVIRFSFTVKIRRAPGGCPVGSTTFRPRRCGRFPIHSRASGTERLRHVLLNEQDRHALVVEFHQRIEDDRNHCRRKPHRRLVEHQELRPRHQRASDAQHLLLSAAERTCELPAPLGEHGRERVDSLQALTGVGACVPPIGAKQKIIFDRQAAEHAELQHQRHAAISDRVSRPAVDTASSSSTRPDCSGRSPTIARRSVLLPAALLPTSATNSPALTSISTIAQHDQVA